MTQTRIKTMNSVTFENGNKEVTITATAGNPWESETMVRIYFDLECTGKRQPVRKFYEVLAGATRDKTVTANGRNFAFELGIDANSKTKIKAVTDAMTELAKAITA